MDEHSPSGNYRPRVKLWEGSSHVVWRGVAEDSGDPVVIKEPIGQQSADRIRAEAAMGDRLRGLPGVREVLALDTVVGRRLGGVPFLEALHARVDRQVQ